MQAASQARDDFDRVSAEILLSDADLALTFVELAETTADLERKRDSLQRAQRAYESICASSELIRMNAYDLSALKIKLQSLKSALDALAAAS